MGVPAHRVSREQDAVAAKQLKTAATASMTKSYFYYVAHGIISMPATAWAETDSTACPHRYIRALRNPSSRIGTPKDNNNVHRCARPRLLDVGGASVPFWGTHSKRKRDATEGWHRNRPVSGYRILLCYSSLAVLSECGSAWRGQPRPQGAVTTQDQTRGGSGATVMQSSYPWCSTTPARQVDPCWPVTCSGYVMGAGKLRWGTTSRAHPPCSDVWGRGA